MAKQKQHKIEDKNEEPKQLGDGKTQPKFLGVIKLPATTKDRWLTGVALVVLLLVILAATPYSRYGISGQFIKKTVKVDVSDSRTGKPVSDVAITIGPISAKTNAEGVAVLAKVPVGNWTLSAGKKYYTPFAENENVPLLTSPGIAKFRVVALGNQVTIKVLNKLTDKPVSKASLSALGATTTTDSSGTATMVLPISTKSVSGSISAPSFNTETVQIVNNSSGNDNFSIVPSGKVYYLSNATGTIDVMGSNLDGSGQQVLVAGTGRENNNDTQLVASTDWKHLMLYATRETSQNEALYEIDTETGDLSLVDQTTNTANGGSNAGFSLIGWYGHHFVYEVDRYSNYGTTSQSIKSYNADTGNLSSIYQTAAANGFPFESISGATYFNGYVTFLAYYWGSPGQGNLYQIDDIYPDGTDSGLVKSFPAGSNVQNLILEAPDKLDYALQNSSGGGYYQIDGSGNVTSISTIPNQYQTGSQVAYIYSPSSQKTFWYEYRDGNNSLFIGDKNGENGTQVDPLSAYTPFGWYTDNYVLFTDKNGELFIGPADFSTAPTKISDYYSSKQYISGYGSGYGG